MLLFLVGLLFYLAIFFALHIGPAFAARSFGAWAGLVGAILALPAWAYLGPRPIPGFLNGTIAVGGLFALAIQVIVWIVRAARAL